MFSFRTKDVEHGHFIKDRNPSSNKFIRRNVRFYVSQHCLGKSSRAGPCLECMPVDADVTCFPEKRRWSLGDSTVSRSVMASTPFATHPDAQIWFCLMFRARIKAIMVVCPIERIRSPWCYWGTWDFSPEEFAAELGIGRAGRSKIRKTTYSFDNPSRWRRLLSADNRIREYSIPPVYTVS